MSKFEPIMNGENLGMGVSGSKVGVVIVETLILLLWRNEEILRMRVVVEALNNVWK